MRSALLRREVQFAVNGEDELHALPFKRRLRALLAGPNNVGEARLPSLQGHLSAVSRGAD